MLVPYASDICNVTQRSWALRFGWLPLATEVEAQSEVQRKPSDPSDSDCDSDFFNLLSAKILPVQFMYFLSDRLHDAWRQQQRSSFEY